VEVEVNAEAEAAPVTVLEAGKTVTTLVRVEVEVVTRVSPSLWSLLARAGEEADTDSARVRVRVWEKSASAVRNIGIQCYMKGVAHT